MKTSDIFLELSESNDDVFHRGQELRVLSGLHKGAAIILTDDLLTIGSDHNCTVVLTDEGVQPIHISLRRKNGGGWVDADNVDFTIKNPFAVSDVFLNVVDQGSEWIEYTVPHNTLTNLDAQNIATNLNNEEPEQNNFSLSVKSIYLLLTLCLSSLGLIAGYIVFSSSHLKDHPTLNPNASQPLRPEHILNAYAPKVLVNSYPSYSGPGKIIAIVSGSNSYVFLNNGQRLYIGDGNLEVYFSEISEGQPIWKKRNDATLAKR
jgi:hypothetical protein